MSMLVYLLVYAALLVFAAAVIIRFVSYLRNPIHVRWELYPVAHEGAKAAYGGSFMEEVEWWNKPREVSKLTKAKAMAAEILLLKAVWEHNRSLWFVSFPFHFGLYMIAGFLALIVLGAITGLSGVPFTGEIGPLAAFISGLTAVLGPVGLVLCLVGATGLLLRRVMDGDLRTYSAVSHYFNLVFFIVWLILGLLLWWTADPTFAQLRGLVANLISFNPEAIPSGLLTAWIAVSAVLMAYIPLTHMSHFFMKYFLYHDIRWGDEPNVNSPETDAKIATVLNYPVTWAAPHVLSEGRKTWAEVATWNPARQSELGSEEEA